VADVRSCEQCGAVFVPRREHARFCCVGCRVAWNREKVGDPAAGASALVWSVTAMSELAGRLSGVGVWDRPRALAAVGEAVWWVTIVDATLVRHHLGAYDAVVADRGSAERRLMEGTLTGLRFVRNRIGREAAVGEFVQAAAPGVGAGQEGVAGWRWRPVPEPTLTWLAPRGQAWEMTRYQAYQAHLAGQTIGEVFGRAVAFLTLAAANATSVTDVSAPAAS
jgi:hypothetical protein